MSQTNKRFDSRAFHRQFWSDVLGAFLIGGGLSLLLIAVLMLRGGTR